MSPEDKIREDKALENPTQEKEPGGENLLHLMQSKRFLPLFLTQALGALNDNVFKNALVLLITYKMLHLSPEEAKAMVTQAAGIFILPFFLFSAIAGQLSDKFEKSRLIRLTKYLEIIIMGLASYGFLTNSPVYLMVVL